MKLFQFYHYHDMEMKWINERMSIANSTIQGKSLNGAQSLLQKQKVNSSIKMVLLEVGMGTFKSISLFTFGLALAAHSSVR